MREEGKENKKNDNKKNNNLQLPSAQKIIETNTSKIIAKNLKWPKVEK